nr:MAG TPA: hypothetical protein [Bacteriophage sp.]
MKNLEFLSFSCALACSGRNRRRGWIGRRNNNSTWRDGADPCFAAFRMYFEIFHGKRCRNGEK